MTALDFETTTLDPRELSYAHQLSRLESEGWELDVREGAALHYLRRHQRVGRIIELFAAHGQQLRLSRLENGMWTASVKPISETAAPTDIRGATALEAAEAAWAIHGV